MSRAITEVMVARQEAPEAEMVSRGTDPFRRGVGAQGSFTEGLRALARVAF